MKKILLFLVLLFTFVLTQAQFEEAGEKSGIEIWIINEEGNLSKKKKFRKDKDFVFPNKGLSTYIVLETEELRSLFNSKYTYNIYYIIRHGLDLELRRKVIEHVINLWKKIGFHNVTITRTINFLSVWHFMHLSNITKIKRKEPVVLKDFLPCWLKRLYKLRRIDEEQSSSSEKFPKISDVYEITQVTLLIENLNQNDDFVFECDSKALIFNLSGKQPTDSSKKLAKLITNDKFKILIQMWSENELPPDWFKGYFHDYKHVSFNENNFMQILNESSSISDATFSMHQSLGISVIENGERSLLSLGEYTLYGYLDTTIDDKKCYIMWNNIVEEAVIFLGNEENFENIKGALIAGEKLEVNGIQGFLYHTVSTAQIHNLSAMFILAFFDVQKYFYKAKRTDIMSILKKEKVFPD